jgi:hypothetical protein
MNNNYLLIEMNRYGVGDSTVNVVSEDFITKWIKFRKKMGFTEAPIAKLKHEVKGWDEEEVTFLWMPTTKQVDKAGEKFMKSFLEDMEEEEGIEL